jgi:hypothetical protein
VLRVGIRNDRHYFAGSGSVVNRSGTDFLLCSLWIALIVFMELLTDTTSDSTVLRKIQYDSSTNNSDVPEVQDTFDSLIIALSPKSMFAEIDTAPFTG